MMSRVIDLNCDLGEGMAHDAELLALVTSANIACGGHAGDEASMRIAVRGCLANGVAIGAHPSYPDRTGFGRAEVKMSITELELALTVQIAVLERVARVEGAELVHVKPHGMLYHSAMTRPDIAEAVARASARTSHALSLVGLAGAPALDLWRSMGFAVLREAFADRRYEADGTLRARSHSNALITDPHEAAAQALQLARSGGVDTICVHSDTPGAVEIARAVRTALRSM